MSPKALPPLFFVYILVFQVALVGVLHYLYGSQAPVSPHGVSDPVTVGAYVVGVAAFALGFVVPQALAKPKKAKGQPLETGVIIPYLLRLCLFETAAVAGFALGILSGGVTPALPLAALALLGTLASLPTSGLLRRIYG